MPKKVVKRETRFAVHLPRNSYREDTHYIKELVTYSNGSTEPRTYLVENFERPVWVTSPSVRGSDPLGESKPGGRGYRDKKEFETVDRLISRRCTESELDRTTANLLNAPHLARRDVIKKSPYVYGYDISSTSLIKLASLKRNNFTSTPYSVAAFDIETTTSETNREILMAGMSQVVGDRVRAHVAIWKPYLKNVPDIKAQLKIAVETYLPKYKDNLDVEITVHNTEVDVLKDIFKIANQWAPDFLAIWNMDFDIGVIMKVLEDNNVNPIDVICDLSIPRSHRVCRYRRGATKKVTASGVVKPVNPSLQWHTLISTSKFYVIDAMCVYRQLRVHLPEKPSYSLDYTLQAELGSQKLNFSQADEYSGAKWHDFMQEEYPVEYVVYNIYDGIGMLELEDKNADLSSTLPDFAGITDFSAFHSQSAKLRDALFLFGLEEGKVIGTTPPYERDDEECEVDDSLLDDDDDGDDYENPDDYNTLGLAGWIQLLPQNYIVNDVDDGGLRILEDFPLVRTNARGKVMDADKVSSYPSVTNACNVSSETTSMELIEMEGIPEKKFRQHNLGVCLGSANTLEYFEEMFGLPPIYKLAKEIDSI